MNIKTLSSYSVALAVGAFLAVAPASATTISFTTSASPTTVGVGGASFTFTNANVPSFDPTGGTYFGPAQGSSGNTVATSFGGFSYSNTTAGSNVIDVKLAATVSNGQSANLDYKGTVTTAVVGGVTTYSVNFSGTTGGVAGTGALAGYTELVSNGVTYAIQTVQQLNVGKQTWLSGYIQGIPAGGTPEPATFALTGLAFGLAGVAMRKKIKASN